MLNLNAMFGSCESIFDQPINKPSVSVTDLQMMEMEINMLYGLAKSRRDLEAIKKDHEQGAQTPNT
jgi:hypothetical protein